jgi:hypothetical protein
LKELTPGGRGVNRRNRRWQRNRSIHRSSQQGEPLGRKSRMYGQRIYVREVRKGFSEDVTF